MTSRTFHDAIAYGGWSLDLHPPAGIDVPDEEPCIQHPVPHLYDIPLRACISRTTSNLMFAGRNMSATHVAFSSTRVMATCAAVGQGVGTAAAHASQFGLSVQGLADNVTAMKAIQQCLLREDAFLIGHTANHRRNVGRLAVITASSEQATGDATNVVSGITRSVHGSRGAPVARRESGSHRWMSAPEDGLPAWLKFTWDVPVVVEEVQLILDTGLHRHLTLSHHDGYASQMKWGVAQPETVADYRIDVQEKVDGKPDSWKPVVDVTHNYQRLRRHPVAHSTPVVALRVNVTRTNGLDHARIVEVSITGRLMATSGGVTSVASCQLRSDKVQSSSTTGDEPVN